MSSGADFFVPTGGPAGNYQVSFEFVAFPNQSAQNAVLALSTYRAIYIDIVTIKRHLSFSTVTVLQALASGYRYGFDVMDATSLPSGTVYPALSRLERAGFIHAHWEDARIAREEKRPPRRYYEVTPAGAEVLEEVLAQYRSLTGVQVAGQNSGPDKAHG